MLKPSVSKESTLTGISCTVDYTCRSLISFSHSTSVAHFGHWVVLESREPNIHSCNCSKRLSLSPILNCAISLTSLTEHAIASRYSDCSIGERLKLFSH